LDSAKNKKQIEILQERLDRLRADLPAPKAPAGAAGAAKSKPGNPPANTPPESEAKSEPPGDGTD
jgi:hypothetical protein